MTLDYYYRHKGVSRAHGCNGGIVPDSEGKILSMLSITPEHAPITGTDDYVHNQIILAGGHHFSTNSIRALVYTEGDRYRSLFEIMRTFLKPEYRKKVYQDWYQEQQNGVRYVRPDQPKVLTYE